jgi:exonuclease SbcD
MERLRRRFPHTVQLVWEPAGATGGEPASFKPESGRSDHAIALDFVAELRGRPASDTEAALLLDACDSCTHDRDLDRPVDAGVP